jgi:hypothetical protein
MTGVGTSFQASLTTWTYRFLRYAEKTGTDNGGNYGELKFCFPVRLRNFMLQSRWVICGQRPRRQGHVLAQELLVLQCQFADQSWRVSV